MNPFSEEFWEGVAATSLAVNIRESIWVYPFLETVHVLGNGHIAPVRIPTHFEGIHEIDPQNANSITCEAPELWPLAEQWQRWAKLHLGFSGGRNSATELAYNDYINAAKTRGEGRVLSREEFEIRLNREGVL